MSESTKVYKDRGNGSDEYFTYSDGQRVRVSQAWIASELRRGHGVEIVDLVTRRARGLEATP